MAIFAVMDSDSILAGTNTFVSCVHDVKASLQLLYAPKNPRRVGLFIKDEQDVDALYPQLLMQSA